MFYNVKICWISTVFGPGKAEYSMKHNQIGNKIRELRMSRNMTQAELGDAVGVSMQAVSKWERGGTPDIDVLIAIARYFGSTMDELLGLVPDRSGQLSDVLFSTMLHSTAQNKMEEATDYCWSIFKGMSGLPSVQDYNYSSAPAGDVENSRCRVSNNNGISFFLASEDAKMFALAPEPEEGFGSLLGRDADFVELFGFLSDPDVYRLLLFICSRPQLLFSKRLATHATKIPEPKVKKVFQEFEKRGWLVKESADLDRGTMVLYRTACKEHVIFFLLFAREMMINPKFWYLTCASKRTEPLLRNIVFPGELPSEAGQEE